MGKKEKLDPKMIPQALFIQTFYDVITRIAHLVTVQSSD